MTKPIGNLTVIYDGDCPFCSSYVAHVRLRDVADHLQYVNARDGGEAVADAVQRGFDLDEGMLVVIDGVYHYGADAMRVLADLTSAVDAFNRLTARLLTSPRLSRTIYPVLRFGRNMTLRLLGREKLALRP